MKKSLPFVLALAFSLGLVAPSQAAWINGTATNPGAGQVIVEAVQTDDGQIGFCVYAAATVAATMRIQHRNAANDTTIKEQYIPLIAAGNQEFCVSGLEGFVLLAGERVRVINNSVVVGAVSVSMKHGIT